MCSLACAFILFCRCGWTQVLWVVDSSWEIQNWESYWRRQFCSRQRVHGQVREDNRLFTDAYLSALELILTWMNRRPSQRLHPRDEWFCMLTGSLTVALQAPLSLESPGKNTGVGCQPLSRGSSRPKDQTWVSPIAGWCFTVWATRKGGMYVSLSRDRRGRDTVWV